MKILKGILSESKQYYLDAKKKLEDRIVKLPSGSIKARRISGREYFYLQVRKNGKVVHKYLGKDKPQGLAEELAKRVILKSELRKVEEALRILRRAEGRKHD